MTWLCPLSVYLGRSCQQSELSIHEGTPTVVTTNDRKSAEAVAVKKPL